MSLFVIETENWKDRNGHKEGLADFDLESCLAFPIRGCGIAWACLCWVDPAKPMARGVQIGICRRKLIVYDGAVDVQVKTLSAMSKATILSGKKQTFCGYMNIMGSILDYE